MGENITTLGIDLLALPVATLLYIGPQAIVEITGLRNPCTQLDNFLPGLMNAVLDRDAAGNIIRKAGIMGIVKCGGKIHVNDEIRVVLPPAQHRPPERI
jgi:MOSC domain-containing protein YiiM